MPKEYQSACATRPATIHDIPSVLDDLMPAELEDFYRAGVDPVIQMLMDFQDYETTLFLSPDSKPMVLLGVNKEGNIWMQQTNEVFKHPRTFMRLAKWWLKSQPHKILHNSVDIQNTARLRMLKRLGFKCLRLHPVTKENIYYVEVVKLWSSH